MDDPGPDPEGDLSAIERHLARLRPARVAIDRDRLMFEAGRASALSEARKGRSAPALAAILALVALGLFGLLARERAGRKDLERLLAVQSREAGPPPPAMEPARPVEPSSYLALTRQILREGPDPSPLGPRTFSPGPSPGASDAGPAPLRTRGGADRLDL